MFGHHHRHHGHGHHGRARLFAAAMGRGGMPPFGGERRGRGGGRRRLFDGDQLKLILLALLEDQPRHGYDLIREIEARSGGAYVPSPGVVYPTLALMNEMGLIDELADAGARRRFTLTADGQAHLADRRAEATQLLARLAELGADHARGDVAPVRRALASLHMALRDTIGSDPDRAHAAVDIIDEATRRIERLGPEA